MLRSRGHTFGILLQFENPHDEQLLAYARQLPAVGRRHDRLLHLLGQRLFADDLDPVGGLRPVLRLTRQIPVDAVLPYDHLRA